MLAARANGGLGEQYVRVREGFFGMMYRLAGERLHATGVSRRAALISFRG